MLDHDGAASAEHNLGEGPDPLAPGLERVVSALSSPRGVAGDDAHAQSALDDVADAVGLLIRY